ncbi:hypothetical protein EHW66_09525 [Erwinia psidii]|uniref:Uncharacterized protein n=1 Tax=Erwinia psidii TaxID=69224 RepID=A0A3N6RZP7_9GAMM|nr:hypothetical protein [Erwinia psidii]MCX8956983.1 hypothetical protein [Erwinia psidii]MCX8965243.1 hypothetical protein [Erwinia psidii]RQM37957.1 hypothetical protein EB241_11770 [Erwinia psidii]
MAAISIKVEINGLLYDSNNARCKCILSDSQSRLYAFIQVIDGPAIKRYWGEYSHNHPEDSIRKIMEYGGKWPVLPH